MLVGSLSLVDQFIEADAVDEYRLRVFPTAAGEGQRLFRRSCELELVSLQQIGPTALSIYSRSTRTDA